MEIQEYKILISEYLSEIIINEGYKRITLDEIAANLGISKKSIYRVFKSKKELTYSIFIDELNKAHFGFIHLMQEKSSMIKKVENLSKMIENYIRLFNENSLNNLRKEYPDIWKDIALFRKERVLPLINSFLNHSKKLGLIIDYPNELIIKLYSDSLSISTGRSFLIQNNFDYNLVFNLIFEILLNGIITKKGKKLLAINKRMQNENN
ncbi:MAG: TetR/AcrR family transcriptional regulator [Melioribacteraceae bacterium]